MNPNLPKEPGVAGEHATDSEFIAQLEQMGRSLDSAGPAAFLSAQGQRALIDGALRAVPMLPMVRARRPGVGRWLKRPAVAAVFFGASAAAGWTGHSLWKGADSGSHQAPSVPQQTLPGAHAPNVPQQLTIAPVPELNEPATTDSVSSDKEMIAHDKIPSAEPNQDLLKAANELRRQGDLEGAKRLYLQVVRQEQGKMAAYVAQVAAAELELKQNPTDALKNFTAAQVQHPSGSLDLEILQGIAQSHHALGNVAEERKALLQIRDRYPNTLAARNAMAKLALLATPATGH